jgi:hypothetical protein
MKLKLFVQHSNKAKGVNKWRPAAVCVSAETFGREKAFDLLSWISYKYGYGTYIHLIKGMFNEKTHLEAKKMKASLLAKTESKTHTVYIDTMISPSYTSSIAQIVQLPGISGMENNMVIFEFLKENPVGLPQIVENYPLVRDAELDVCILRSTSNAIRYKNGIDIWVHHNDVDNVNLMILLAYIMLGHPVWKKAKVKVYYIAGSDQLNANKSELLELIKLGRIPMSENNVEEIPAPEEGMLDEVIQSRSKDAGLVFIGFNEDIRMQYGNLFTAFDGLQDVLFVNSYRQKTMK